MRFHVRCFLIAFGLLLAALSMRAEPRFTFQVLGQGGSAAGAIAPADAGAGDAASGPSKGWARMLSAIGLIPARTAGAGVVVAAKGAEDLSRDEWFARVEGGTILVLEGASPLAEAFGFKPTARSAVLVRSVEDLRAPGLRIIWEKPLELACFEMPPQARVFARERWQKIPLLAGYRKGAGAVLWAATSPGENGYERFPYLPQALLDVGLEPPFRSGRLWAFFDSSYRTRVDLDYFARRWRSEGIGALHVAAWHYWEPDPDNDEYLRKLIDACHRNAILVYAWIELPHVSDRFWEQHPEWREKTALLQDAQLDWRKLINLTNPQAFEAVSDGMRGLLGRFDWDGVNLAELYFESLEGHENPSRFTPMNDDVRSAFLRAAGFDPLDLFQPGSPRHWTRNTAGLARFLEFRAGLAQRQQTEWIGVAEALRKSKPHLDLALTHIDDRFDTAIRDKLGADASRTIPLLQQHDFTFLIEDPATIWNLGPQRYPQIAARYAALTHARDSLGVDINIVERYQDVYPTKQQTGAELLELIHTAAASFARVALYFEFSIPKQDAPLTASAASGVTRAEWINGKLVVESPHGASIPWDGPSLVDGKPWPFASDSFVLLPAGVHVIEKSAPLFSVKVLDFNGDLKMAAVNGAEIEFAYQSSARAMAKLDQRHVRLVIDGIEQQPQFAGPVLLLPRGQHLVRLAPN